MTGETVNQKPLFEMNGVEKCFLSFKPFHVPFECCGWGLRFQKHDQTMYYVPEVDRALPPCTTYRNFVDNTPSAVVVCSKQHEITSIGAPDSICRYAWNT